MRIACLHKLVKSAGSAFHPSACCRANTSRATGTAAACVLRRQHFCTNAARSATSTISSFVVQPSLTTAPQRRFLRNSSQPTNSAVPRTAISFLGATNAGKSLLLNLLTQSDVSLVHSTAGTTADPKSCLMELHGRIGPVRLTDTPGIDEMGELGQLKRQRALQTIGQSDVVVIVVDPFECVSPVMQKQQTSTTVECVVDILREVERRQIMNRIAQQSPSLMPGRGDGGSNSGEESTGTTGNERAPSSPQTPLPLLVFNLRQDKVKEMETKGGSVSLLLDDFEKKILEKLQNNVSEDGGAATKRIKPTLPPTLPPTLAADFSNINVSRDRVISFLECYADPRPESVSVLPDWLVEDTHAQGYSPTVFLNIPMDQQTPQFRLLRPQAMVQEALIRNFVSTYAYRMDLNLARSDNPNDVQREKDRFLRALDPLVDGGGGGGGGDLKLLVTDSQAIDIVAPWTLDASGNEMVPITTFSIAMIRYLSGGRLAYFSEGLTKLDQMVSGQVTPVNGRHEKWRVLISEACNHTRLNLEKQCADIGTVQLPNHLTRTFGKDHVEFEYAFGKHVIFDPTRFDLVVHCGGCMLSPQQMDSRVADLMAAGVPATNYGLLLSRIQSPVTLSRVLKPWGIQYNPNHSNDSSQNENKNGGRDMQQCAT